MIFHSTDASAQVAARALSHTTETAWSKFCPQGKRVRMRAICARLRVRFGDRVLPMSRPFRPYTRILGHRPRYVSTLEVIRCNPWTLESLHGAG